MRGLNPWAGCDSDRDGYFQAKGSGEMNFILFLIKRIVSIALTTCVIIALSYTLMYFAPGSFFNQQQVASGAATLQAENPRAYAQMMKEWENRYGLNKPLYIQIGYYIYHSFTLNFGTSFENPTTPILSTLEQAFPVSFTLAFGSIVVAAIVGIPLGIFLALRRNTWIDLIFSPLSMAGQAIPAFVFAVFLVVIFGVFWPILPTQGWGSPLQAVLPILALAFGNVSQLTRFMRSTTIDTLRQDFIRTARAKGVPEMRLILRHVLRNSLVAVITMIGPTFAFTIVGTVWVENIFALPGLGMLMQSAFGANDYPLAITYIFMLSLLVMIINLLVDISYRALDPRVRI